MYYDGNYDKYVQQVEERQLHEQRLADGIERKRDHMEKRWERAEVLSGESMGSFSFAVLTCMLSSGMGISFRTSPSRPCSVQEGLKQARKAGDDKKLGMVASRK